MAKKFTDEELSRVLSHAHELIPFGTERRENFGGDNCCNVVGCINQAAYNIGDSEEALKKNYEVATAFDKKCGLTTKKIKKTPLRILRFLEHVGAA